MYCKPLLSALHANQSGIPCCSAQQPQQIRRNQPRGGKYRQKWESENGNFCGM
jgi:hypothetical protein